MRPVKFFLAAALACAVPALARNTPPADLYTQITPLEQAVASNTATPAQQLDLARLYLQAGRFYEAQKLASQLLQATPNDAAAIQVRDEATKQLNALNAQKIADAAARAKSGTTQDRLTLANAYFDAGRYAEAADTFAAIGAANLDRDAQVRYARSLAWSDRLDAAERAYEPLVNGGADPALSLEYGRVLSWMGANSAAINRLTDVYNTTHSEGSVIALANAQAWSGDAPGATRLLNTYVLSHPNASEAKQLLQQLQTSPETRLQRVQRLIDLMPYNLALHVMKARLQYEAGHYSESLKTVQFVRQHTNSNIEGLGELARADEQARQAEIARLDQRLHALEPSEGMSMASAANADEMLSLAKAYVAVEDYDKAIPLYDRYVQIRPDDMNARIQYARVLSWDSRWRASEEQYKALLDRYPDRADLRLEYGQVLSYDSDYRDALHVLNEATDLSGNPRATLYSDVPPRAYYNIGQIYRWYGWNEHDVAAQNQAIAMDSAYDPARSELDLVRHLRPTSTVEGRYTYATDSDNFTLRRYDLSAEKWVSSRTAYDLAVGRHEFDLLGDSVNANVFNAGAQYRMSDSFLTRGNVGVNFYDQGVGTRPFFGLGGEYRPSLQSRAALDFNHYDLVYDVFTLQSLTTPLTGQPELTFGSPIAINDVRGHYDYNSGGFWSALADASYGFISDANRRTAAHGIAAFRVWKEPFIALKADAHYLGYDFRSNRYWSPTSYHSLAGVLQVGQNVRDRFFWNVELKAGKAYESGFTSDLRAYEGSVTVPLTDRFDLIGDYGYGKSGRLNSLVAFNGSNNDFVNYWQRHFYVGVRVKQLFSHGERGAQNSYYYDNSVLAGAASPVIPPLGETH